MQMPLNLSFIVKLIWTSFHCSVLLFVSKDYVPVPVLVDSWSSQGCNIAPVFMLVFQEYACRPLMSMLVLKMKIINN